MRINSFLGAALLMAWAASPAIAAGTDTDTFDVSITIQPACEVSADSDLSFGTQSFLDQPITGQVDFSIQCTNGTTGTISLDQGTGSGGLYTLRYMENGTVQIEYGLYKDAAYSTYWGNGTGGSQTFTHIGDGTDTPVTIYAKTSVQGEPAAGTYTDTITITVSY